MPIRYLFLDINEHLKNSKHSCYPCPANQSFVLHFLLCPLFFALVVAIIMHPITQIINLKDSIAFSIFLVCAGNHQSLLSLSLKYFWILYIAPNS